MNAVRIEELSLEQAREWLVKNDPMDRPIDFDWATLVMTRKDAIDAIQDNIKDFGTMGLCVQVETGTKEAEIRERIKVLEADSRLYYKPANIMVNAPLAIEQIGIKTELKTLYWVLGEEMPTYEGKK